MTILAWLAGVTTSLLIGFLLYVAIGCFLSIFTGEENFLDWGKYPLMWLFYMVFYPAKWLLYNPAKWAYLAYKERNHIPTPSEVAAGMIAQLAVKHPEKWDGTNFKHKNVEIWRTRRDDYGREWTWEAKIGHETVPLSQKNLKLIDTSIQIRKQLDRNKAQADKEHSVLNEIEVLLK